MARADTRGGRAAAVRLLAAVLLALAGCTSEEQTEGPAMLVVDVNVRGERSFETFALAGGRLTAGELRAPRVYGRAGSEPDRQSIAYEEIYLVEADGDVRQLTDDRRPDLAPQLLEDGRVAFVSCVYPDDPYAPPACALAAIDPET